MFDEGLTIKHALSKMIIGLVFHHNLVHHTCKVSRETCYTFEFKALSIFFIDFKESALYIFAYPL